MDDQTTLCQLSKRIIARVVGIAAAFALSLQAVATAQEVEGFVLAHGGETPYALSVAPDTDPVTRHAAAELAAYLLAVSGATLPQAPSDADPADGPYFVLGRDNPLAAQLCPSIPYDTLGKDGFAYCTSESHVVIAGATPRGTLYGVYFLLDRHLGVRWFSPEYTYVPQLDRVELAREALNQVHTPHFAYREIFAAEGHDPAFRQHNLMNGDTNFRRRQIFPPPGLDAFSNLFPHAVHNFKDLITGDRSQRVLIKQFGFRDTGRLRWAPHPDYEHSNQILFMNEDVRHLAAERLIQLIELTGDAKGVYGLSQNDGPNFSPDPDTEAFAQSHGGALSAPLLDMVIDVADRVRAVHPEAQLSTLAYMWSVRPPTGIVVPEYVQVMLAPYWDDRGIALTDPHNSSAALIEGWSEIADSILIWDYLINFNLNTTKLSPYPTLEAMCGSIKGLAAYPQIKGYFGQADVRYTESKGTAFAYERMWLASRLLWDPDQDCQELLDEFVAGFYGDASPFVRRYIELIHDAVEATAVGQSQTLPLNPSATARYFTLDVLHQSDQLFDEAEAAVADQPVFLEHVRTARLGIDLVILMRHRELAAQAQALGLDWTIDAEARLERFTANAAAAGVTEVSFRRTIGELLERLRSDVLQ